MKKFEELVEGKCVVITEDGEHYEGSYNPKYKVVFFCIPADKNIVGYLQ